MAFVFALEGSYMLPVLLLLRIRQVLFAAAAAASAAPFSSVPTPSSSNLILCRIPRIPSL